MKLSEIRKVLGDRLQVTTDEDLDIRYLLTDSRLLDVQRDNVQGTKVRAKP
jgi:hypothetical protein